MDDDHPQDHDADARQRYLEAHAKPDKEDDDGDDQNLGPAR